MHETPKKHPERGTSTHESIGTNASAEQRPNVPPTTADQDSRYVKQKKSEHTCIPARTADTMSVHRTRATMCACALTVHPCGARGIPANQCRVTWATHTHNPPSLAAPASPPVPCGCRTNAAPVRWGGGSVIAVRYVRRDENEVLRGRKWKEEVSVKTYNATHTQPIRSHKHTHTHHDRYRCTVWMAARTQGWVRQQRTHQKESSEARAADTRMGQHSRAQSRRTGSQVEEVTSSAGCGAGEGNQEATIASEVVGGPSKHQHTPSQVRTCMTRSRTDDRHAAPRWVLWTRMRCYGCAKVREERGMTKLW